MTKAVKQHHESLLKHIVNITGHRDHAMLDVSVISAVQEWSGASQTRVLAITTFQHEQFVQPRATISAGKTTIIDDATNNGHHSEPLSLYPALLNSLKLQLDSAELKLPNGQYILWLAIWHNDKTNIWLEITNPGSHYDNETRQVIDGIISVYRNFQNLLDYSERDSLTGLLNRKTFDSQLEKILSSPPYQHAISIKKERRQSASSSNDAEKKEWLATIDIDHFKRVNDEFGHIYGDEVLILVANLMLSSFRSTDKIFRFGGEEFVVLLRNTTFANAQRVIERFRMSVERHTFPKINHITVSIGFVNITKNDAPVAILGHADQALYYAKTRGRNQVFNYEELVKKGALRARKSEDEAGSF